MTRGVAANAVSDRPPNTIRTPAASTNGFSCLMGSAAPLEPVHERVIARLIGQARQPSAIVASGSPRCRPRALFDVEGGGSEDRAITRVCVGDAHEDR